MDLKRLLRTLFQQRLIVAFTLLVTVGGVVALANQAKDEYESSVNILVLRPAFVESDGQFVNINPLLSDGRNVSVTSSALIETVLSPTFDFRAAEAGVESSYGISFNPSGGGALLTLTTVGETPLGTVEDLQTVFDLTVDELDLLQQRAGVSTELRVNLRVSSEPSPPTPLFASKARVVLATAALGIGMSVNMAFVVAALRGRSARRSGTDADSVEDSLSTDGQPDVDDLDVPQDPFTDRRPASVSSSRRSSGSLGRIAERDT